MYDLAFANYIFMFFRKEYLIFMSSFSSLIRFGYSPSMLFPNSFTDPLVHYAALMECCHYPQYEAFETFLPEDAGMRKAIIKEMKANGIVMNYNSPAPLQQDGPFNPTSPDPQVRANALEYARRHVDFAGEAESKVMVSTGCPDKGDEARPELNKRYMEFFLGVCEHAKQYNLPVVIEPMERHRFKKLHLGPTKECAEFIAEAQKNGADNAHLMMDLAHLPLMEENMDDAIAVSQPVGLIHVHMGNAVLNPDSPFYGHTHPPIGVQSGIYDAPEMVEQFIKLFECGFIPKTPGEKRASISLEVRPYLMSNGLTSIQLMYEKSKAACDEAAHRLGIY